MYPTFIEVSVAGHMHRAAPVSARFMRLWDKTSAAPSSPALPVSMPATAAASRPHAVTRCKQLGDGPARIGYLCVCVCVRACVCVCVCVCVSIYLSIHLAANAGVNRRRRDTRQVHQN